jgi:hypothetical protein
MHRRILQVLALGACLGLLPAAAYAKGGQGGKPSANKGKGSSQHGSKEKDKGWNKDKDKDKGHGHEHQAAAGRSDRPKGWDEGKKTGWGDCNVPPGLAKQRGCDSHGFSARERSVHNARRRGFRDCAVSREVAQKRGCDSRGLSSRERAIERERAASRQPGASTTRRVTKPKPNPD